MFSFLSQTQKDTFEAAPSTLSTASPLAQLAKVLRGSLYGSLKPPETASLCSASLSSGHCSQVADPWASRMASHCWQAASPISSHRARRAGGSSTSAHVGLSHAYFRLFSRFGMRSALHPVRARGRGLKGREGAEMREKRLAAMFSPSKKLHRLGHLSSWAS